jgi:hypothetical protein
MKLDWSWLIFWFLVWGVIWALKRRPNSRLSRAAFTWFGPSATQGELLSTLQSRWLAYSLGWLARFGLAFSALVFAASRRPPLAEETWFQLLGFILVMGIMLALLASLGFVLKFLKVRYVGPNPISAPAEKSS